MLAIPIAFDQPGVALRIAYHRVVSFFACRSSLRAHSGLRRVGYSAPLAIEQGSSLPAACRADTSLDLAADLAADLAESSLREAGMNIVAVRNDIRV